MKSHHGNGTKQNVEQEWNQTECGTRMEYMIAGAVDGWVL